MHLSVDHHILRSTFGEEKAFKVLKNSGFDATDYSFHEWPADDPVLGDDFENYTKKTREYMEASGLVCPQCHAPFDFVIGEPLDDSSLNYLKTIRAVRAAAVLGADHIAVHSIYSPVVTKEEEWKANLAFFRSLIPVCEDTGVKIAIENLPLQASDTPEQINDMIKELDSPWFGALLDTGHAMISGITPDEYIRRLDPGILLGLHIQDMSDKKDRHWIPYMGEIDWDAFLSALKEYGYAGDFSLEIIHFMESVPADLLPDAHCYAAAVGKHLINKFVN